ncbi:MAG: pirin family protein [Blastocatellia bacterium]
MLTQTWEMSPPRYQGILNSQIPAVSLPDGQGTARVIAGEFAGAKGPANTFTPIHVWDLRLASGQRTDLALPDGYTTALVVLKGAVRVNGSEAIEAAEVGLFDRAGKSVSIECVKDTTALLLCGEPIDEPIVGQGPFVMNTSQEIRQAMADYISGKMGHLS